MSKDLVLLRGLPGSGKTTLATLLAAASGAVFFSIDDYFTDADGTYAFRYQDNHLAYDHCIQRTKAAMAANEPLILVHNTFVYDWEMKPYIDLAETCGYRLHVCTVEKYHGGSNTHEVSEEQITKMATKFMTKLY
jgi:predicted kinase